MAAEAIHRIGRTTAPEIWYVEGLATGLSTWYAIKCLGRENLSQVIVCYSDGNLVKIASKIGKGIVIADHDKSEAGEKAAKKSRIPYWMSHKLGDANDYHLEYGIERLASEMRAKLIETSI